MQSGEKREQRGGKRESSGRKKLNAVQEFFVAEAVERYLFKHNSERNRRWLARNRPLRAAVIPQIRKWQRTLNTLPVRLRGSFLAIFDASDRGDAQAIKLYDELSEADQKLMDTALDVRVYIQNGLGKQRFSPVPPPADRDRGRAYAVVARWARQRMGFHVSPRMVEQAVNRQG